MERGHRNFRLLQQKQLVLLQLLILLYATVFLMQTSNEWS